MKFDCGCEYDSIDFETPSIPLDCSRTWDFLGSGLTKGVFQLEKSLGKRFTKEIKPRCIDDLAAVISLIRPGCLEGQFREDPITFKPITIIDTYIRIKNGTLQAEYIHPVFESIFKDTYGVPIYQEQIMRICSEYAGFTLKEADDARKAMGKKDKEKMKKVKEKFLTGAKERGHDEKMSDTIFGWIDKFSSYGFNKCVSSKVTLQRPSSNQYGDNKMEIGHLWKLVNNRDYAVECKQIPLRKKLRQFGYGKCLARDIDGRIRPRDIKTIHFNGPKELVRVVDSNGRTIDCTIDHKFMTENGQMIPVGQIGVGGKLICHDNVYENTFNGRDYMLLGNDWQNFKTIRDSFSNIINCEICNSKPRRLEWHHIDSDRTNNVRENLLKLCVSCHKKEDYKMGRTSRWEKGHKTSLSTIVSITPIGIEDTYDVEMDTEEHNWIANDFVVSNSHAVSYALIGYMTAYAKVHTPLEFFNAMLSNSDGKQDSLEEIQELVNEAKLFNIIVRPPNLSLANEDFGIQDEKTIAFGLAHIKGIGANSIASLKKVAHVKTAREFLMAVYPEKPKKTKKEKEQEEREHDELTVDLLLEKVLERDAEDGIEGAKDLLEEVLEENREKTIESFENRVKKKREGGKLNKTVCEALIKSGSVDHISSKRVKLLECYRILGELTEKERRTFFTEEWKPSEMFDAAMEHFLARPKGGPSAARKPKIVEAIKTVKAEFLGANVKKLAIAWEKFYLGVPLTGSLVELYFNSRVDTKLRNLLRLRSGHVGAVGVVIEGVKKFKDKNGNWMCFMTVSDETYINESFVLFAKQYNDNAWIVEEGKPVLMLGRKDKESFIVNKIEHL